MEYIFVFGFIFFCLYTVLKEDKELKEDDYW